MYAFGMVAHLQGSQCSGCALGHANVHALLPSVRQRRRRRCVLGMSTETGIRFRHSLTDVQLAVWASSMDRDFCGAYELFVGSSQYLGMREFLRFA